MTREYRYVPRDCWLAMLADGWRFANDVAAPMVGGHGAYSVLLWRVVP